jgi:hypothetical protein
MRPAILVLVLLFALACQSEKPTASAPAAAEKKQEAAPPAAAGSAPDAKGRSPFVHCLDLIREQRYPEALTVCREADKANPGDPQVQRAIEIAEAGGEGQ